MLLTINIQSVYNIIRIEIIKQTLKQISIKYTNKLADLKSKSGLALKNSVEQESFCQFLKPTSNATSHFTASGQVMKRLCSQ